MRWVVPSTRDEGWPAVRNGVVTVGTDGAAMPTTVPPRRWPIWGGPAVVALLIGADLVLTTINGEPVGVDAALSMAGALVMAAVGGLLVGRHPRNPVGWVLVAIPLGLALQVVGQQYGVLGLVTRPGSLPAPAVVAGATSGLWTMLGALMVLFLTFPDGRLPSPRWRLVGWIVTLDLALMVLLAPITAHLDDGGPLRGIPNPLWPGETVGGVLEGVWFVAFVALMPLLGVTALSLAARYRRAAPDVRAQLRWVLVAVLYLAIAATVDELVFAGEGLGGSVADAAFNLGAIVLLPVTVAVAIFRYRLYDVDRILRRTVSWTAVTALVVGVYAAVVLAAESVLGARDAPDLVVAGATLAAAAVARPVRHRVQRAVDRRFNRSRYDAERVVAAFAAGLRDDVDARHVIGAMREVTHQTLEPASVSVWQPGA